MKFGSIATAACFLGLSLASTSLHSQSFGTAKETVQLQRRLPALAHLSGNTIKVKATAHREFADLAPDLESLLETELLKNDPRLSTSSTKPSTLITCEITDYSHPRPIVNVSQQSNLLFGKKTTTKTQTTTRITGSIIVAFQARTATGQTVASSTVSSKYDETFDSSGNDVSHGIMNTVSGGFKRLTGNGGDNQQQQPPTDAELSTRLLNDVVHQIASYLVTTNESVQVYLAKQRGPLEQGDKEATAGLWERALETYETAQQNSKPEEDAYRLYNIGVAYEALAYKAEDTRSAMKFLDESAINYGKAIDAKPGEKYFLEPQKRIETAIAHYKKLEDEENEKTHSGAEGKKVQAKAEVPARPGTKALTNDQVVAMVKSGMDDDIVAQTIKTSKLARFDLSTSALQALSTSGVSDQVLKAMKARAARGTVAQR